MTIAECPAKLLDAALPCGAESSDTDPVDSLWCSYRNLAPAGRRPSGRPRRSRRPPRSGRRAAPVRRRTRRPGLRRWRRKHDPSRSCHRSGSSVPGRSTSRGGSAGRALRTLRRIRFPCVPGRPGVPSPGRSTVDLDRRTSAPGRRSPPRPPATARSRSPARIRAAVCATASILDAQNRLTVLPGTVWSQPARRVAVLARLAPCSSTWVAGAQRDVLDRAGVDAGALVKMDDKLDGRRVGQRALSRAACGGG